MKTRGLVVSILAGLVALPALGARMNIKDGPFLGYAHAGDVEDAGPVFGWGAAWEPNRHSSLEFTGSWHDDSTGTFDFDVLAFALTGRVGFIPHPSARVYGGAGLGYYLLDADNERIRIDANAAAPGQVRFAEAQFDKDFGYHLAAGAEVMLTPRWELFLEYRYVWLETDLETTTTFAERNTTVRTDEAFSYDHGVIRLGLNWRF